MYTNVHLLNNKNIKKMYNQNCYSINRENRLSVMLLVPTITDNRGPTVLLYIEKE